MCFFSFSFNQNKKLAKLASLIAIIFATIFKPSSRRLYRRRNDAKKFFFKKIFVATCTARQLRPAYVGLIQRC